jgi:hypothetical protein
MTKDSFSCELLTLYGAPERYRYRPSGSAAPPRSESLTTRAGSDQRLLACEAWRNRREADSWRNPDCRHKPAGFRGFVTAYARESRRANPAAALCSKRSISFFDRNC